MTDIARSVAEGLKSQPGLLAIVAVNVLSLVFFAYVLHEISASSARDDALLTELIKKCSALSSVSFSY